MSSSGGTSSGGSGDRARSASQPQPPTQPQPHLQLEFKFDLFPPARQLAALFPDLIAAWPGRGILAKVDTRAHALELCSCDARHA
jgi:hypothetical protein